MEDSQKEAEVNGLARRSVAVLAGAAMALSMATVALGAVTFDPATGTGFVGKGDVQLIFGWNNKALQDNAASVQFRASTEEVTEVSWECTNERNENIQERARTTTTTTQGVVSNIARVKNQITGFNLTGYSSRSPAGVVRVQAPLNSCPSGPPEVVSSSTVLEVSSNGTDWFQLQ
jgi:hypothetical protein